jgi:hypothetical protein
MRAALERDAGSAVTCLLDHYRETGAFLIKGLTPS